MGKIFSNLNPSDVAARVRARARERERETDDTKQDGSARAIREEEHCSVSVVVIF